MAIHPDVFSKPAVAKRASAVLANVLGATVLQSPDGKGKRILHAGRVIDCTTWLACYCQLHQLRADQVQAEQRRATVPVATYWTGPLP